MKPIMAAAAGTEASPDAQLVRAAREGSDEAFEVLFRRYSSRITAYVNGVVQDQGRAEDIVQEVFMSALRSLRETDRAIAFRPWIYGIAKNACIDQFRRSSRADEVSFDSEELTSEDQGRLQDAMAGTDFIVSVKEDLESLRKAFGGLSASQHQILVLRELEGLSYEEIGARTGLSQAAVESSLFRARRRLRDEFDEIATGARCRRMQTAMAEMAEGVGRGRVRRALVRHLACCARCRREAMVMGLGSLVARAASGRNGKGALSRLGALLPLPLLFRRPRRRGPSQDVSGVASASTQGQSALFQLSPMAGTLSDPAVAGIGKVVAVVVAAALVGGGAGIAAHDRGARLPVPKLGAAAEGAEAGPAAWRAGASSGGEAATMTPAGLEAGGKDHGAIPRPGSAAGDPGSGGPSGAVPAGGLGASSSGLASPPILGPPPGGADLPADASGPPTPDPEGTIPPASPPDPGVPELDLELLLVPAIDPATVAPSPGAGEAPDPGAGAGDAITSSQHALGSASLDPAGALSAPRP